MRDDGVLIAVQHEHRAADATTELQRLFATRERREFRGNEYVWRGLESPTHAIVDLLGRVRLGKHLRKKELQKPAVILVPVMSIVLRPAFLGRQQLIEGVLTAHRMPWRQRYRWRNEPEPAHTFRVFGGERERAQTAQGQ